jgi:cytochrome c6
MMRRFFVLVGLLINLAALLVAPHGAWAEPDLADGAKLFGVNCASCHAGGINRVVAAKNLSLAALQKYGKDSVPAITTQIRKGKGAMPAFKKLSDQQVENLANYVLAQAQVNWGK